LFLALALAEQFFLVLNSFYLNDSRRNALRYNKYNKVGDN